MHRFLFAATTGLALAAASVNLPAVAQGMLAAAADAVPAGDVPRVVDTLASLLEGNFVFPATGDAYARALRAKLARGGYAGITGALELARAVTADLQAVSPDRHLRLFAPRADAGPGAAAREPEPPILRSGWLAPGVAYIAFSGFPGDPPTIAAVGRFLDGHAEARTLIIDERRHHGGEIGEANAILSRIFARRTELLWLDTRAVADVAGEDDAADPTLRVARAPAGIIRRIHYAVPAAVPSPLVHARIFLLTSRLTASAGEHLALALKRTRRATLIGETTAGAGHYGRFFDLPGGYRAFIPFGRTYDPTTGKDWEGTGVTPDVRVGAADALDEALRRSGVSRGAAAALAALD